MRNDDLKMRPRPVLVPSARRRGLIAFTALIMLSILVVVTLAASEEMGLEAKAAQNRNAVRQAYLSAYTGIDYGLYLSRMVPGWRTLLSAGDFMVNYTVGRGTVTVTADDPGGGAITNDPIGVVRLTAQAKCDLAKRTVTILSQPPPGPALRYAICSLSDKDLNIRDGVSIYGDIRTGGNVIADPDVSLAGNIYTAPGMDVDAHLIDGDTQLIRTEGAVASPPVDFAWYQSVAQELTLPFTGGAYVIENTRITPDENPFGFAHAQGLYYFDAGGNEVHITDSYVIGSLIFANVSRVTIKGGYYHKTHLKQYPALLCDADIWVEIGRNLEEIPTGVDFNGDGDTRDRFVSQIRGVIYSSGEVRGFQNGSDPGPFYIAGAVIADEVLISGPGFHVSYDPELAETAVAGFQGAGLVMIKGSMQD